jgi:hypothetical protein
MKSACNVESEAGVAKADGLITDLVVGADCSR